MPIKTPAPPRPLRLGLVLYPGCMPAGLFATADIVRACNQRAGGERLSVVWTGSACRPVRTHNGLALKPQVRLEEAACDALLLPGLWLSEADGLEAALRLQEPLIDALRHMPRQVQLWSYCVGVALAAAAGRLDGCRATAAWWLQQELASRFKRVRWQPGVPLCVDGKAATAPGPHGHLQLAMNLIGSHYAVDEVRDVQEVLMLPLPRARHPAFDAVDLMTLREPLARRLLVYAQRTAARSIGLAQAAEHLSVSVRTLCRLVKSATGLAPGEWLRRVKLHQASEALRRTRLPVKAIADELGFSDEASLHRAFKAVTGLTPGAYRQSHRDGP